MSRRDPGRDPMTRVSPDRPCPVCGRADWCLVAEDGSAAICQRTESPKRCGDAGWLHRLTEPDPRPATPRRKPAAPRRDWDAQARRFAADLTPDRRAELAAELGLPADALDALPLLGFHPSDPGGPCFTSPEVDGAGNVVGLLRRYAATGEKKSMAGGRRGLIVPAGWRDRPGAVYLVEGPTDALAMTAAGIAAVGRPSNSGGAEHLAVLLADLPPDRRLVVLGERDQKENGDWPGRDGAAKLARRLARELSRPVTWELPPGGSKDVRAWLTDPARADAPWPDRGRELDGLLARPAPPAPGTPDRPRVLIGPDEFRVNTEAVEALGADPDVYQRGGVLVRVVGHRRADEVSRPAVRRSDGDPVIREVGPGTLREALSRRVTFARMFARGEETVEVEAHPPGWCVRAVHERGDWPGVRRLTGLVTHPVFLPDGSVLAADGYDPGSGLLVLTPPGLAVAVPDRPTRADVARAVGVLGDVVADFPFQTPAHRAGWFAAVLTPGWYFAFDGPSPLYLIDKNTRGAGAGLLADTIALTLTGGRFPVMGYTPDPEELRKRVTTLAVEGDRLVLIDNLSGAVGDAVLDAALTATTWKDRLLGSNRGYNGPLNVTWFATGNNVQLAADTSRRVCPIRMESADERPERRTGFRHPDLRGFVRAHRGALLSAALTVARGWATAGRPRHGLPAWGSYEGWSDTVREMVVFAGLPDPGETREELQDGADRDAGAMRLVLDAFPHLPDPGRGVTAADFVRAVKDEPADWAADARAAVEDLCGKLDARSLGYKFRHFRRRNFGGRFLDVAGRGKGTARWVVRPAAEFSRAAGSPPSPPSPPGGRSSAGGDGGDGGDVYSRSEPREPPEGGGDGDDPPALFAWRRDGLPD